MRVCVRARAHFDRRLLRQRLWRRRRHRARALGARACRIVWAHYNRREGTCSDQVGEYKLGEGAANTPMK
jgi:hypothetical protein